MDCKAVPPWTFIGIKIGKGFGSFDTSATKAHKSLLQLSWWAPSLPSLANLSKSAGMLVAPAEAISLVAKAATCCTVCGDSWPQDHCSFNHCAKEEGWHSAADGSHCLFAASFLWCNPLFFFWRKPHQVHLPWQTSCQQKWKIWYILEAIEQWRLVPP